MTHTIRTSAGRNAVWIEADYGQGRRGKADKAEFYRVSLASYLESIDLIELDFEQAAQIKNEMTCFARGYAYRAEYGGESVYFATAEQARNWIWSRDC